MQEEFPVPWDQANLACRYLYICRYLACKFELLKCCVCVHITVVVTFIFVSTLCIVDRYFAAQHVDLLHVLGS